MRFNHTSGYEIPLLCVAIADNQVREVLLFDRPLQFRRISICHNVISRRADVERAKSTVGQVYAFLEAFEDTRKNTRDAFVFGARQAGPCTARGLEVQRFMEQLLGYWVTSPALQGTAVDGMVELGNGWIALSFKSAGQTGQHSYRFRLGSASNHHEVQLYVVGFRHPRGPVCSLGVVSATAVNATTREFTWGPHKPFPGVLNITTRDQLQAALRQQTIRQQ